MRHTLENHGSHGRAVGQHRDCRGLAVDLSGRKGQHLRAKRRVAHVATKKDRRCSGQRPSVFGFGGPATAAGTSTCSTGMTRSRTTGVSISPAGKESWSFDYGCARQRHVASSRTTPTVDGERVYTSGAAGKSARHQYEDTEARLAQEHLERLRRRRVAAVGHRPESTDLRQPVDRGAADVAGGRGRVRQADR